MKEIKSTIELFTFTDNERKTKGEVFTPLSLVNEMLDKLPVKVWSDKDLKWLEPAGGFGNFIVCVFERLMVGLRLVIEDDIERERWIKEEMLYYNEFNTKNVEVYKRVMGLGFKLNIHHGDYLELDVMKEWGVEKFDVVVGNPPYQGTGRKKIYIEFLCKNVNVSKMVLYITPTLAVNYLLGAEICQKTIKTNFNLTHINFSNSIKKYFNSIGSDFCYYLINNNIVSDTEITYTNDVKVVKKLEFNTIININTYIYDSIVDKCFNLNGNEWCRRASRLNKDLKDIPCDIYKNKIVYKIRTNDIEYKYTKRTHKDMSKPKVLFPTLGDKYIIDNGKLFPGTSFVVYITCETIDECKQLIILKQSKLFNFFSNIFQTQRSSSDYIWRNLKRIKLENLTEQKIYDYFNLTKEEIELIEN